MARIERLVADRVLRAERAMWKARRYLQEARSLGATIGLSDDDPGLQETLEIALECTEDALRELQHPGAADNEE